MNESSNSNLNGLLYGSGFEEPLEAGTRETIVPADEDNLLNQVKLTNNLLCGIIFFLGLIFGIIGLHLLFSRIGNGKEN